MSNEELIKYAVIELFEKANLDVIHTVFSSDYIAHAGNKVYKGHDFIKRWTKQLFSAIAQIRVDDIEILANDDKSISWQRIISGIHINDLRGIPPSHKRVSWTELVVSRFENDKIIEEWVVSDLAGELMLKQAKH